MPAIHRPSAAVHGQNEVSWQNFPTPPVPPVHLLCLLYTSCTPPVHLLYTVQWSSAALWTMQYAPSALRTMQCQYWRPAERAHRTDTRWLHGVTFHLFSILCSQYLSSEKLLNNFPLLISEDQLKVTELRKPSVSSTSDITRSLHMMNCQIQDKYLYLMVIIFLSPHTAEPPSILKIINTSMKR